MRVLIGTNVLFFMSSPRLPNGSRGNKSRTFPQEGPNFFGWITLFGATVERVNCFGRFMPKRG